MPGQDGELAAGAQSEAEGVGVFTTLGCGTRAALVGARLYVPKAWIEDPARCQAAGIPEEQIRARTKIDLARELIKEAIAKDVEFAHVGIDSFYGPRGCRSAAAAKHGRGGGITNRGLARRRGDSAYSGCCELACRGTPCILPAMNLRHLLPLIASPAFAFGEGADKGAASKDTVVVDAPTEQIINGALRWLASKQNANGSWSASEGRRSEQPVAMTGYVLLAFMATGNLPEEGEYARQVKAGLDFLLDGIGVDGQYRGVDGGKYMYNHGIATIALGELYGQSRNPAIREKLQRAIRLIVTTQSGNGQNKGGWRYQPRPGDADISVTVLQVVALRAAKNAGLDVPQQTIDDAVDYVKRCAVRGGGFAYQAGQGGPGYARTAAAIYSLQVCGHYDDPLVLAGSQFLFDHKSERQHWTYGSNYAGPAQYMIGGDVWRRWYEFMKADLLPTTRRVGEMCFWDDREVGSVYATACYTTILAMPWHYIPLYQR